MKNTQKKFKIAAALKDYMTEKDIKFQKDLAQKTGFDDAQISKWLDDENISLKSLNVLVDKLDGFDVFVRKTGVAIQKDTTRDSNKYNVSSVIDLQNHENNLTYVPLKAYGGFLRGYSNRVFMETLTHAPFPSIKGRCWAFEVEGFSMSPDFNPGDYAVCTEIPDPSWLTRGREYVFQTIDGLCIKTFEKIDAELIHIRSINEEYQVEPLPVKTVKKIYYVEQVIKKRH